MIGRANLAAALAFAAIAHAAGAWDLQRLFESLAQHRPARAAFHEKKYLALLERPVESSGELVFTPPSRLERRTLAPRPENIVIDGDTVVLESAGKRRSLSLREQPAMAVLVESMRATLAGDLGALVRAYSVALDGTPQSWRLVLRPLDAVASTLVDHVEISGADADVRKVEIFQADGDRSVITITPAR